MRFWYFSITPIPHWRMTLTFVLNFFSQSFNEHTLVRVVSTINDGNPLYNARVEPLTIEGGSTMKNVLAVILTLVLVVGASAIQTSPSSDQNNAQQTSDNRDANRTDHRDWGWLGLLGLAGLLGLRRRDATISTRETGVRDNLRKVG
jgi:MYXO-CTERM domain-containing protein